MTGLILPLIPVGNDLVHTLLGATARARRHHEEVFRFSAASSEDPPSEEMQGLLAK